MRYILPLLAALLLMGARDCEELPPNPDGKFCAGSAMSVNKRHRKFDVSKAEAAVLRGTEVPDDKKVGLIVSIPGGGYCSGNALGPHSVLTAAHCGFGKVGHEIRDEFQANGGKMIARGVKTVYPSEYLEWTRNSNVYARETDIMIIYTDVVIPERYWVQIYQPEFEAGRCQRLVFLGAGRTESDPEPCRNGQDRCIRWAEASVDAVDTSYYAGQPGRLLKTGARSDAKICFGDSGSALLAELDDGSFRVAGVTSTTASSDCERWSHHVNATSTFQTINQPTAIKSWILHHLFKP